jgi:hypothetical protein
MNITGLEPLQVLWYQDLDALDSEGEVRQVCCHVDDGYDILCA